MRPHLLLIAISALAATAAVAAEPPKTPVTKAEQPVTPDSAKVVAAAEQLTASRGQEPQQQANDPAKPPRHARVTSCRCGDQNPSD